MSVLVYAYPRCEDIELVASVDTLRRCGAKVTVYAETSPILCAHGTQIVPDTTTLPSGEMDAILLPGGAGCAEFAKNAKAAAVFEAFKAQKKLIFAICAAPGTLVRWGILSGETVCGYPGCEAEGAKFTDERVVAGAFFVTARGPGVAIEFGLACAQKLGLDAAKIGAQMLVKQ
ncbi:Protein deglycase [Spironucleus salmonicida]|uniref:4-methyl-5-thiazole monophosphate biosynthesis enzyme n=1 Tax=Spironucleus salmonicida TaxID=348837 RepID=V6LV11_9EUKA|nr:Protein deglycase [Spironucleus salmonicida]|eukprot:EST48088.1 4-methyl-5-thiazole monophosphate biosynthesis enzyme [Spironucleus salmonicida]